MSDHARLSPSNHRWPNCAASVEAEAAYPNITNHYAIDGTGSHLLLELCLKNSVDAITYDRQIIGQGDKENPNGWLVDAERCARVQGCLDYIVSRVNFLKNYFGDDHTVQVSSESKSNPGSFYFRTDWYGTCDITIMVKHNSSIKFVEVIDYKDGTGFVGVDDYQNYKFNTQLVSYLAGKVLDVPDNILCRLTVYQPKAPNKSGDRYRYADVMVSEIKMQADKMNKAAEATEDPNAPFSSGPWCKWCLHGRAGNCETFNNKALTKIKTLDISILDTQLDKLSSLDATKLADMADLEAEVQAIFDEVKKEIQTRLDKGQTVPGYKMLPGNNSKVWAFDDKKVADTLSVFGLKDEDIYIKKIISPAQFNKLKIENKKTITDQLIVDMQGELRLKKVGRKSLTTEQEIGLIVNQCATKSKG